MNSRFEQYRSECPCIAILRGVQPNRAADVANALISAGIKLIEVPMNSPDPFVSISAMIKAHGDKALFGAGTLTTVQQLQQLQSIGGTLAVSPHVNEELIRESCTLGLLPFPGFYTPTEAFRAIDAGAKHLKYFPAGSGGTSLLRNLQAVLPNEIQVFAVGGISGNNIKEWQEFGVDGFGVGSSIFKPGRSIDEIYERAVQFVQLMR